MKEYKRLATNTAIFAIGNIGSRAIGFLLLPLFTRYMAPAEYGKLDVINTTISLLVPILSFQIIESVFRFAVDIRGSEKGKKVFSNAVVFSFVALALSTALYPILRNISIFSQYAAYFYAIFFLTILNGIAKQFVRGLGMVRLYAVSDILYSAVFAGANIVFLVVMHLGAKAYLLSTVVATSVSILFLTFLGGLREYFSFTIDKDFLKDMLKYSIPLIPNGIMWWVVTAADRYFLSYYLGYEATGLYSVAARFPALLTMMFGVFFPAWQLSAMEEYGKEHYDSFFKNVFGMFSSLMFAASSFLFVVIRPFMRFYVSANYFESWKYVIFLFLGAVFHTFASFYGVNYTASKKTAGAFTTSVLAAITEVVTILPMIKIIGIQAASLSTFFAYLVMWIARIFHTRKYVKVKIDVKHIVLSSVAIITQAILLLMMEGDNVTIYLIQVLLFAVVVLLQKKYMLYGLRFGMKLIGGKKS
ncbi:MAG: lipopolysaccharide biosynthesis protein [Fervidobacterium sp.]|uniref:lipopolysaccharide biosynthesis protein n=1 Tax=Fervidobacterium sp. TaxID=1871331 RepID=UPI00404B9845